MHDWNKVHSTLPDRASAINIERDAETNILMAELLQGVKENLILPELIFLGSCLIILGNR